MLATTVLPATALLLLPARSRFLALPICLLPALTVAAALLTGLTGIHFLGAAATVLTALGMALAAGSLPRRQKRLILVGSILLLAILAVPPVMASNAIVHGDPRDLPCDGGDLGGHCGLRPGQLALFALSYWSILVTVGFGIFGEMLLLLALFRRPARRPS